MKKYLFVLNLFFSTLSYADVPPHQLAEVKHLLNFVKNSECTINRNGTDHAGNKGVEHIQMKYDYFKDDIKTTEDFIKYSATKSTMSGSYYTVKCPEKNIIKSQDWLLTELKRYRSQSKESIKNAASDNTTVCKEPRPQICTMEYVPVCAKLKDNTFKTFASGCSACSDKNVILYKAEKCQTVK